MAQTEPGGQQPRRAGRILDPLLVESSAPAPQSAPRGAGRVDVDPAGLIPIEKDAPPSVGTQYGRERDHGAFDMAITIVALACLLILGLLYGMHLVSAAFADISMIHPLLAWIYMAVLAVATGAVLILILRAIEQYRSLGNISKLQSLARTARAQQPVEADRGREMIVAYLDNFQNRCDAQTQDCINRLQTKFGQYGGDLSRDFNLLEELVLEHVDRQVEGHLSDRAFQVAFATALAPHLLDPIIVCGQAARVVREISTLYGGRPGVLGTLRLLTRAASAAVFAEMANLLGDALAQISGTKAAAKLGARVGEGLTNGFMILRLGEATKRLCRPVPLPSADLSHSFGKLVGALLVHWKPNDGELSAGRVPA
jgi:putative membrane protein